MRVVWHKYITQHSIHGAGNASLNWVKTNVTRFSCSQRLENGLWKGSGDSGCGSAGGLCCDVYVSIWLVVELSSVQGYDLSIDQPTAVLWPTCVTYSIMGSPSKLELVYISDFFFFYI